ncbi:glycoside hydrolase [Georgenia faecalis]|uniref:glycoside hydrolase n=1 Tax=Georgenia faecalis TaxID=2483799 RepID=UPI000FDAD955|nr:glycoside hydrolase [Georgenia faecalis]
MTTSSFLRRSVAAVAAPALVAGAVLAASVGAAPPSEAAAPASDLTITPNPWYASDPFQGWGTSLVWFANATGDYPDELRDELYQRVFGEEGMDLNIARYNIGGGHASDVVDYLRPGGAVEGYWAADATGATYGAPTTYANREAVLDAWDPDNPEHYDWSADATQRWWVEQLTADEQITHWETFANSAPYFMTQSGYVSGGIGDGNAENLRPDAIDAFTAYLTTVTEQLEEQYGIDVATIDPFNEPNTNYWSTTLRDGVPVGGRQEGMHVGPQRQVEVITSLAERLADEGTTTDAVISAMDETNPGTFVRNWSAYPQATRDAVEQMNVHTYGTGGRLQVRDLSKSADTPLWMSEVEGSWVDGFNPSAIENGLGLAERITSDLRELEANAWVLWQPVEDLYNMEPTGEDLNWGSVFLDFDCEWYDEDGTQVFKSARRVADAGGDSTGVEECSTVVGSKFNVMRNYTQFLTPGVQIIPTSSPATTAAVDADGTGVTLVHANARTEDQTVRVDLSGFAAVEPGATATAYVTTESPADDPTANGLVPAAPVAVDAGSASVTLTLPAQSVSSIVIDGVSGVAEDVLVDGADYQFAGVQSGKPLTAGDAGATITAAGTTPEAVRDQVWTVHEVPGAERGSIKRYVLEAGDGEVLGATAAGTDLRDVSVADAAADPETVWILNTTNGTTYSWVNQALSLSLDVAGQSSADGTAVGVYGSNGGANQTWTIRGTEATGSREVAVSTLVGVTPTLPDVVVPLYPWGEGAPAPVTWEALPETTWATPGEVVVAGTAVDVFGNTVAATARVVVGSYTLTDPVSLTVREGSTAAAVIAAAPETVPARAGASTVTFDVPVQWDWDGLTDAALAEVGVVTVTGTATSNEPGAEPLAATLSVIVTTGVPTNIAPLPTTTAAATYTEGSYHVDRTRNGILNDKGWSNWRSGTSNPSDTLSYTFAAPEDLHAATVYFYRDGAGSWAETLRFEYRDAAGTWTAVPGYEAPVAVGSPADGTPPLVTADLSSIDDATGLRVVLNARPGGYMTVAEVEIEALTAAAGSVADLAALRVDGVPLEGFTPEVTDYEVTVQGSRYPSVLALPVDSEATVSVEQPADGEGTATVVVTAADGETTRTYTLSVARQAVVTAVTLPAGARVGVATAAAAGTDPEGAELSYQWLLDGAPIEGATEATYTPVAGDAGRALSVAVSASADGFVESEPVVATAVTVAAAPVEPTDPPTDGPTDGPTDEPTDGAPGEPGEPSGEPTDGSPSGAPSGAPGSGGGAGDLPATGAGVGPLVALAALLAVGGLAVAGVRRARTQH